MCARAIRDGAQAQLMRGDIRLQLGFLFVSGKTLPQRVYDNEAENSEEDSAYDRREHVGGEVQVEGHARE